MPKSVKVQYWDGFKWQNATNHNVEWADVSNEATNITFDRVMTSRIRIGMENATPYSEMKGAMSISQFKVFDTNEVISKVAAPSASVESGTYDTEQSVELSSEEEGADIYYTTDSTIPTTESTKYTEPIIIISTDTTLKAIAVKEGMADSNVVEFNYVIEVTDLDVTELEALIETAKAYTNEDGIYTEASFTALQEAITAAEAALDTIETEEELANAITALQEAIDGLEKVDSSPNENREIADEDEAQDEGDNALPHTATSMYTILVIGLILLTIGVGAFCIVKRNRVRE